MATGSSSRIIRISLSLLLVLLLARVSDGECDVPVQFRGDWFSMERGDDVNTLINDRVLQNNFFEGVCQERWDDNATADADGNYDSKILFYTGESNCYRCYYLLYRSGNVVQYKQSECRTPNNNVPPTLEVVCDEIMEFTEMWTFFRKTMVTVNCKNTFEGVFHFTYEWDIGGGGICDASNSQVIACQEPGSPYVDNEVFKMNFAKCPEVSSSRNKQIKFQCMGMWEDEYGNVWSGVADLGREVYRERFRCMLTRYDQEIGDNKQRYSMSWWADCSTLKSPYEGPVRLVLQPVIGGFQLELAQPSCNFPTDFAGHWYHTGEYDVNVDINNTHIYFNQQYDLYRYKETHFICLMTSGTRYLTMAVTVGKCEIDVVCFELLPRHHSIIRWRISKPYRITSVELSYPDYEMYMFRQTCAWSSFTIDRTDIAWNYKTFMLNPPIPMPCPIRGRYSFTQKGPDYELYRTRIRGITYAPRHMVDCRDYVTEFKSCDATPTKISIDAEYCETVDHTGRPVGEYDEPDWELTCIGHWDEDWNSYLITWDPEDAMSSYRCWNYERQDWRHIWISRSTCGACSPAQSSKSYDPIDEGASLALALTESERQYDDCSMIYLDGDPLQSKVNDFIYEFGGAGQIATSICMLFVSLIVTLSSI